MLLYIGFVTATDWSVEDDDAHHEAVGRLVDWLNCEIALAFALHGVFMMRTRLAELESADEDQKDRILAKYCRHISFLMAACVMYPDDPQLKSALTDLYEHARAYLLAPFQFGEEEFVAEARDLLSNFEAVEREHTGAWVGLSDSARIRSLLSQFAPGNKVAPRYRYQEVGAYSTSVVCTFLCDCCLEIVRMLRDGDQRARASTVEFSDLLVEAVTTTGIILLSRDDIVKALNVERLRLEALAPRD